MRPEAQADVCRCTSNSVTGEDSCSMQVGPRLVWKDQEHPLRRDASLSLTGIPTLVRWGADGPEERIGTQLERAGSVQEADQIVAQFLAALTVNNGTTDLCKK